MCGYQSFVEKEKKWFPNEFVVECSKDCFLRKHSFLSSLASAWLFSPAEQKQATDIPSGLLRQLIE